MTGPPERLMLEDNELLDDDGESDGCGCCCGLDASCVDVRDRPASLEVGEVLPVLDGNLYGGARTYPEPMLNPAEAVDRCVDAD